MKDFIRILLLQLFISTIALGQIVDVSELYQDRGYFFPNFEYIGENQNLPHYRISSLIEDKDGFLWIGTRDGGLIKYDGYDFSSFELNTTDPFSLSSNDISFVFEDSRDMIWVGTDNSLCYYQPFLKHFLNLKLVSSNDSIIHPRNITCVTETEKGDLLFGTNIGVFEVSNIHKSNFENQNSPLLLKDSVKIKVSQISLPDSNIIGKVIRDIVYDFNGILWILSKDELGYINYDSISQHKNASSNKTAGNYRSVVKIDDGVKLFLDDQNVIWANNLDNLYKIQKSGTSIIRDSIGYNSDIKNIDHLELENNIGNKFWTGYYDNNLKLFDEEKSASYPITFKTNDPNNIHNKGVSCFLKTKSNVIFVGTAWGGLYKVNPTAIFSNYHPGLQAIHKSQTSNLRYVFEDTKGYIWLVAENIYRCDKNTGQIIATYDQDFFNIQWSYTNKIIEDRKGQFWVGMESRGLFLMDIENDDQDPSSWVTEAKSIIKNKTITCIYEGSDGIIWVGTIHQDFANAKICTELYKINLNGNIIGHYPITNCQIRNGNELDQFINQIYIDQSGRIWLATGFGLIQFIEEKNETLIFLQNEQGDHRFGNNRLLSICPDPHAPDSLLWVGSANRGLLCFDIHNKSYCPESKHIQLPTNHIASILPDKFGNLWLGSDKGIIKVEIDSDYGKINQVQSYSPADGLITSDYTNYYGPNAFSTEDKLIFTGPRGFQIVEPTNNSLVRTLPSVQLTDFTINYKPADYGQKDSPLNKPISATQEIVLSHDENTLGFEITAIDFTSPKNIRYSFMLDNYNDDWVTNINQRKIQYTKLPPGEYNLLIRVAIRDGNWSDSNEGLKIKILRPWWKSYYAYFIYGLFLVFLVWLVDKIQRGRLNMKSLIKLNQVEADKLRELDLMKSKFFANISHEFKTPLTLIMNPVDEILSKKENKANDPSLLMIKRNAQRLQRYITEILELSKLDANKLQLNIRELDIVKFIKYQIASFESLALQKSISLKLISPDKEIICYLDPEKINTIFSNLISNAIKFTPEGGKVEIIVTGCFCNKHETCSHRNGCLTIEVKDNGRGIPENHIPFIFNRYYKGDNESEGSYEGTGLGLALVKELVNLHNGSIVVASEENSFTKFQIQFPMGRFNINSEELVDNCRYEIEDDFNIPLPLVPEISDEESGDTIDLNSKIVLVIEDNHDMRALIKAGLKKEFQVELAVDGEEGIQLAIEKSPDLILCDVMMPKIDGFDVARALKSNEITSHIPIIFLTAKSQMSDKITGLETGADDYLIKPFFPVELKARVKNLLEQREQLRNKYSRFNVLKLDKLPVKSIDQVFLEKVISFIQTNMSNEEFSVQSLLEELNISRTQLHRKLKALVNQSANELIQSIRLQKASELIKNNAGTVAEICYQVGFSSPPYFTRLFKQHFGHNPSEHSG